MNKIKLVFIATGDFGVPILEKLAEDSSFELIGVITAPDKPQGRKLILTPTQVKVTAQKFNIPVFSPLNKEELYERCKELNPDIALVVSYGMIFPKKVLQLPKYGCINIHGSILPKYRGASPIHQALLQGDTVTGNTWIVMESKMDAGPVIDQSTLAIDANDDFSTLYKKLAQDAAEKTPSVLKNYILNSKSSPQDDRVATYCSTIDKSDGLVDFPRESAVNIYNKFRAYHEWPTVYFKTKTMNIKITQLRVSEQLNYSNYATGTYINLGNKKLFIVTLDGVLEVIEVQPPSKKPMSAVSFLQGYKNEFDTLVTL